MVSLQADKQKDFSIADGVDEMGNEVPLTGGTATFAVDKPEVVTLTDNGDRTGRVAATGAIGTAVVSVDGTTDTGLAYRGAFAVDVIPGDVVGVTFTFGEPTEVTPDEVTPGA